MFFAFSRDDEKLKLMISESKRKKNKGSGVIEEKTLTQSLNKLNEKIKEEIQKAHKADIGKI